MQILTLKLSNYLKAKVLQNTFKKTKKLFNTILNKKTALKKSVFLHTNLIQLEIYLQTEIRSSLQNAIPFVGELEMTKVK